MNEQEQLDLNELCQALLDERLDKRGCRQLAVLLAQSAEARRIYVRAVHLAASLSSYAAELQVEAPGPVRKIVPFHRRPLVWCSAGALAAIWAAAFLLAQRAGDEIRPDAVMAVSDVEETVARVTGAKDCRWQGASLAVGEEVRRGARLQITAGFLEVTFDSGAQLTLEAPAELEVASAWEAALRQGTVRAHVPPESVGFRVTHPAVEIVDLGTEFTLAVDRSGGAELFVLQGAVEARPGGSAHSAPMLLRESEARRFASAGVSEVKDRERKLARYALRVAFDRASTAQFARWSFDDATPQLAALTRGTRPMAFTTLAKPSPASDPAGRWAGALKFQGNEALGMELEWRPGDTRTIAFWLRLPADAPLSEGGPMLAWRIPHPAATVALTWNRDPAHGVVGALQAEIASGYRTGVTSLRDGRWHHVAIVFSLEASGGKPQMKQYVDAHLEEFSGRRAVRRRYFEEESPGPSFFLGNLPNRVDRGFSGEIDELVVAERALEPAEIQRLMQENRLE